MSILSRKRTRRGRRRARLLFGCGCLLAASSVGCVERRYTIRSDPPGALAIVNGEEIGPTPVSRPFTFYGDRRVRLEREGYEPLETVQPIDAPWYDNLFTEFFTENLVPYTFRDERDYTFKMTPAQPRDTNELLRDAETLRSEATRIPPPRRQGIMGFLGYD